MEIRRVRGGRLPLPSSVRRLDDSDEPALAPVHRFVDALCELPLAHWLRIGRRVAGDQQGVAVRVATRALLDRVLVEQRLGIAAWHVRDAVETVAFLATRTAPPLSRAERRELMTAQDAAEEAALALLAREHLPEAAYETLGRAFSTLLSAKDRGAA